MAIWRGVNVLVTGGAGFIGSALARALVAECAHVTLVDSMLGTCGGNVHNIADLIDQVEVHTFDMCDSVRLQPLVDASEVVFNLAGQTSHHDSIVAPLADLQSNVTAQLSLLECCRRSPSRPRVIFTSTRQVYGRPQYLPVTEEHVLHPIDVNGIHKLTAERYHSLYGALHRLPFTILRLTNTYGPGMRIRDARQNFLGEWIRRLLEGKPIEVWGGQQLRDFNHVDDVVSALLMVGQAGVGDGGTFNLGSPEVLSLADAAREMVSAHGSGEIELHGFPEARATIDIGSYCGDYHKLHTLGWRPLVHFRDGLASTLNYFSKNRELYI